MNDSKLQDALLRIFYDRRADGYLNFSGESGASPIPPGSDLADVLRACGQLETAGLIEWKGLHYVDGNPSAGGGRILEQGIAAIETHKSSPPENTLSHNKVEEVVATYYLERIVTALVATASDDEKELSRVKLSEFLETPAARRIFTGDVDTVLAPLRT